MARVDLALALADFNKAMSAGMVKTVPLVGNKNIRIHQDHPEGGTPRMTYAWMDGKVAAGIAVLVVAEPVGGILCIQLGYAVDEAHRGKGIGKQLVPAAVEDFQNGITKAGVKRFYLESTVDQSNLASLAVSKLVLGMEPEASDDKGIPVWHFLKEIRTGG